MNKNNRHWWFSVIMAILITAFVVILSAWVLGVVLEEMRSTKLVYNSISTYEWAKWANEYALIKIKNHMDWFADSVDKIDYDSKLLASNPLSISKNDISMSYDIFNNWKIYTWTVAPWEFEIIPLFYDDWQIMQTNSKIPNITAPNIIKTVDITLKWDNDYTWNIIWNNASWETFWVSWTWTNSNTINEESEWVMKSSVNDANVWWDTKRFTFWNKKISDFLNAYSDNYLILYNISTNDLTYNIKSTAWFSYPKLSIVWTAKIADFKQNIEFKENKNRHFDALKYSIFNK